MLRKYVSIVTLIALVLCTSLVNVYAQESNNDYVVIKENKEIKDLKELKKLALRDKDKDKKLIKVELKNNKTKEKKELETISYKQLLKEEKHKETGDTKETYAETLMVIQPLSLEDSQTKEEYDNVGEVLFYSTMYYIKGTVNGEASVKLTGASGGWNPQSGTNISNQKVGMHCNGNNPYGGLIDDQHYTKYPSSLTFDYDTPSSWDYIEDNINEFMGVDTTAKLTRLGTSWTYTMYNNY
jgi:hypothetical protein